MPTNSDRRAGGTSERRARRAREATCESVGCPYVGVAERCRECPGPAFFTQYHECINKRGECQFYNKKDQRCIICPGPSNEPSRRGVGVVSFDAMVDGGNALQRERIDAAEDEEAAAEAAADAIDAADAVCAEGVETRIRPGGLALSEEAADAVRKVMGFFASMEVGEFALVKHLLAGGNLNTYALCNNTKRQYAWNMVMRMMRRSPELRAIVKERKQPNGRVLSQGGEDPRQMMLFV